MLGDDSGHKKRHGAKAGVDLGKATQRRSEQAVTLRNKHRLEALMQKRMENADADESGFLSAAPASRSRLHEFFTQIFSADNEQIKQGIVQIRLILGDQDPPLEEVVAIQGAVPRLLQLLEHPDEETRRSAAMCVTNLACGDSRITEVVLTHDGGIKCLQLLAPEQPETIRELMAWAVANLAGSGRLARDMLLAQNAMGILIEAITANPNNALPTLRNLTWAMSNLCRHKPAPPLEAVAPALPVCYHLMQHPDTAVQDSACWGVSYISDGPQERILACQNAGLIPIVLELLRTQRPTVMLPAIRTFGNYAVISAEAAQAILEMGVLQLMDPLMQSHVERLIRKECCWTLSNVAAGTHVQVQVVLDSGLMPLVIRCMSDPELEVKKEAVWVVANIGAAGTPEQLRSAVEHFNCIPGLCVALRTGDPKICSIALEACEAILALGDSLCSADPAGTRGVNPYVAHFEEHGIVEILFDLEGSRNDTVHYRANSMMTLYFDTDAGFGGADWDATGDASRGDYGGEDEAFSF